jgi:carbamoyl-phosphate synthase large subunit
MRPLTILRTGAGSAVAPFVIRALRDTGARVVAADMSPLSVGFHVADAAVTVPAARSPEFLDAVRAACTAHRVDVLFPDVDEELLPIARASVELERAGVRVMLSSAATIERCTDKLRFAEVLAARGLPGPRLLDAAAIDDDAFPVFVKPRAGRGSAHTHRVRDRAELELVIARVPAPLVQELLPGREFTIDTLSDLEGRFLYASVRERLATDSGISVKGRTIEWPFLEDLARQVVEALGVVGPGCLQCILDPDGVPRFTDLNPRLGGGTVLSVAAGAPIIADVVHLLRGEPIEGKRAYRPGLVMLRSWQETYIDPIERVGAVVLDLDDTLYDRSAQLEGAMRAVAAAIAASTGRPAEALTTTLLATWRRLGTDHDHIFDTWLDGEGLGRERVRVCVEAFHGHAPPAMALRPGVADALAALRGAAIPTAIVTDGRASSQQAKVAGLGLDRLADVVVYCAALGAPKPDPRGLVEAAMRLGVTLDRVLYVGDHPRYDIAMARAAGAIAARVFVGEFANRPDEPGCVPDVTAADVPVLVERIVRRR